MSLRAFAKKTIPESPRKRDYLKYGVTGDIIESILYVDKKYWHETKDFARGFKQEAPKKALKKLWAFVKQEIRYIPDPHKQVAKSPARLWADKKGDCKSMSIFIGSVLRHLEIPFSYRFVGYTSDGMVTHVYPVAHLKGEDVPIDAVYEKFGSELPYTISKDYLIMPVPIEAVHGPGFDPALYTRADVYKMSVAQANFFLKYEQIGLILKNGILAPGEATKLKKEQNEVRNYAMGNETGVSTQVKQFFANTKNNTKSVMAGGPAVKISGGIPDEVKQFLFDQMEEGSPFFLYLFIKNQNIIFKMPHAVRQKWLYGKEIFDVLMKDLDIFESVLYGFCRNVILEKTGRQPEDIIAQAIRDDFEGIAGHEKAQIAGFWAAIGNFFKKAVGFVIKLIKKIAEVLDKVVNQIANINKTASNTPDPPIDFQGTDRSVFNDLGGGNPQNYGSQTATGILQLDQNTALLLGAGAIYLMSQQK